MRSGFAALASPSPFEADILPLSERSSTYICSTPEDILSSMPSPPPGFHPNYDMNLFGPIPRGHPIDNGIHGILGPEFDEFGRSHSQSPKGSRDGQSEKRDAPSVSDPFPSQLSTDYVERSTFHGQLPDALPRVRSGDDTESALDRLFASRDEISIDPALEDANPNITPPESTSPGPAKRKATSRANMLARGGACEYCKRRKLKCTAEMPTCSACTRAGRECVYSQKKQRSRVRVLEDRLVELEKRLDTPGNPPEPVNGTYISPATTAESGQSVELPQRNLGWPSDAFYELTPGSGFTLPGFDFASPMDSRIEPDLMTLADAAAADIREDSGRWPWGGLTPDAIGAEIIKAVEGGKGVGEKIVGHL